MTAYSSLIDAATAARQNAYAPYSQFTVGAALLGDNGVVYTGCNVENASYGLTCCAERVALYCAIAAGVQRFEALCIVGGNVGENAEASCMPCGICRQALAEFCGDDFPIVFANGDTVTLGELLPHAFRLER